MQFEPRPQRILLPVNPLFIGFTLACALAFNLLPWRDLSGMPDLVALVLAFWGVHQPRRVPCQSSLPKMPARHVSSFPHEQVELPPSRRSPLPTSPRSALQPR